VTIINTIISRVTMEEQQQQHNVDQDDGLDDEAPPITPQGVVQPTMAHQQQVMSVTLFEALGEGNITTITTLLDAGESVNCGAVETDAGDTREGCTPVMLSLQYGRLDVAKMLVARGADLTMVDIDENNVLHHAAHGGDVGCIGWILENTAIDINSIDLDNESPIMVALENGELDAARMLAARGADLTMVDIDVLNLLHYAAEGGDVGCIDWVLENTAIDINSIGSDGRTSIMLALSKGHLDASMRLVALGANLFMSSNDGIRAIDMPVHGEEPEVFLGPQVLQYAIELRWASVLPLLLLSKSCSSTAYASSTSDSSFPFNTSTINSVFSQPELVRYIAQFVMRSDLIINDPAIPQEEREPDDVKRRIEAALADDRGSTH
jgi:ankyrin repeat protein